MANYAGQHVHKRLVQDEAYKKKEYPLALKNAFIGIDADMKSSAHTGPYFEALPISDSKAYLAPRRCRILPGALWMHRCGCSCVERGQDLRGMFD